MRAAVATLGARARHGNILAGPAIGAQSILGQSNCRNEIVHRLKRKRSQIELFADELDHLRIRLAVMVHIF